MSDQSSESSGEWVILNENEELNLDNVEEQPLNLQLSHDAVYDAVSESIRSSLSSEELEWQYEQFHDIIPQYGSCIEELDYQELKCSEDLDINNTHPEDDDTSKCASVSDFEDDKSIDITPISKIHCYKHNRNDQLNFVLNLMLALVIASAVGLGIGHFIGWSHKCYKSTTEHNAAYSPNLPDTAVHSPKLPVIIPIKQRENLENFVDKENQVMSPTPFSENLSDVICWDPKDGDSSMHQEICNAHVNNDIVIGAVLPETSIFMSEDVLELKTDEVNQNNFSDSGLSHFSNIITHIDWSKIARIAEPLTDSNKESVESNSYKVSSIDTEESIAEETPLFYIDDNLAYKDAVNNAELELFKQFYVKEKNSYKESNLTNQLRRDLSQVIQSLSAIAIARLTDANGNYRLVTDNSGVIVRYYSDFESLVNLKLSEVDNFVSSIEYKKYEKMSVKHLQKMVYSLIHSVDFLMKMSIKTLSRDSKKINVYKFSNNISKVIFNFNKKWEKNNRHWFETVQRVKFQEIKEKSFKRANKHWKRKAQFEKDYRSNKYKKYSMKS